MHPRPVRKFTIADMMILVSAAAVGTLLLRSYMPGFERQLAFVITLMPEPRGLWRAYSWIRGPGSCLVVPGMAALIAIRLRRPRPGRLRLAGQPGFVACLAVVASLVPGLIWYAAIRHRPGFQRPDSFEQAWSIITHYSDTAVAGGWVALALSRRCRPEPSWVDRMGRVLGAYWILLLPTMLSLQAWPRFLELLSRGGP